MAEALVTSGYELGNFKVIPHFQFRCYLKRMSETFVSELIDPSQITVGRTKGTASEFFAAPTKKIGTTCPAQLFQIADDHDGRR
jgi:hypothetical protein